VVEKMLVLVGCGSDMEGEGRIWVRRMGDRIEHIGKRKKNEK
jgi:hypothetical protein